MAPYLNTLTQLIPELYLILIQPKPKSCRQPITIDHEKPLTSPAKQNRVSLHRRNTRELSTSLEDPSRPSAALGSL